MAIINHDQDLARLKASGRIAAQALQAAAAAVQPGVSTQELDRIANEVTRLAGARPSFLNYQGYPAGLCVSVNQEVVHGIPSARVLSAGDIVSLDYGVEYQGWFSDTALTLAVGQVAPEIAKFIAATKQALAKAIKVVKIGGHIGDIGAAVEKSIARNKYGIVRDLCGHGVGRAVHEPPQIPNFGRGGTGPIIAAGAVMAIEPMLTMGEFGVQTKPDGWTVITLDGSLAAHFEHTIVATADGPLIITQP